MSSNDKGNATDIVEFEELQLETDDDSDAQSKLSKLMTHLKTKLSPEDFKEAGKILGIKIDLSNEELLAEFKKLLAKKPEEEEEEEEEEKKAASYKDYMSKCMKGGKSLKECADAWKKKYPEPKKEEIAEVEELARKLAKKKDEEEEEDEYPKKAQKKKEDEEEEDEYPEPIKKKMVAMEKRIHELEEANRLAEIKNEVQTLVSERHLAPVQVDPVTKLSAAMDPAMRTDFLNLFRQTQKFKVSDDVGIIRNQRPGAATADLSPEQREFIMQHHGLASLIADKGVKPLNN